MVSVGLVAVPTLTAEGKLNPIDKVMNTSRKLGGMSNSGAIDVSMGVTPPSRLKESQPGTGPAASIDIHVKDYEKGTYYIMADSPPPASIPENYVLALDGSGKSASKVDILFTDRTGTPPSLDERLDPQHNPRIEIPVDGGLGTLRLNAFCYTWGETHAGPDGGNVTVQLIIIQEQLVGQGRDVKGVLIKTQLAALLCAVTFQACARTAINTTRVVYSGKEKVASLNTHNHSSMPYKMQIWLDAGLNTSRVGLPIVVTSSQVYLSPQQSVQLCLIYFGGGPPGDREGVYWINAQEIPPAAVGMHTLQFVIRIRPKLFYRPPAITATLVREVQRL